MAYTKIRPKAGKKEEWQEANTILNEREIGFEYSEGGLGAGKVKMKIGDGATPWNDLPYAIDGTIEVPANILTADNICNDIEGGTSETQVPSTKYLHDDVLSNYVTNDRIVNEKSASTDEVPSSAYLENRLESLSVGRVTDFKQIPDTPGGFILRQDHIVMLDVGVWSVKFSNNPIVPEGFRPSTDRTALTCGKNGWLSVTVSTNGHITPTAGDTNSDGIYTPIWWTIDEYLTNKNVGGFG